MTPLTSPTHLRADGISKSYPDRRVLTNISLTVSAGEVVGLMALHNMGCSLCLNPPVWRRLRVM